MASFGKSTTTSILVSFFLPIASCIPEWERLTTKAQDATMMFWTRLAFCSLIWGNTCEKWITVTDSVKTHCQVITSSCRTTTYYLSKGQFCFLPPSLPPLHHHASVSLFASFFTFRILPPPYVLIRILHKEIIASWGLNTKRQSPIHSLLCLRNSWIHTAYSSSCIMNTATIVA